MMGLYMLVHLLNPLTRITIIDYIYGQQQHLGNNSTGGTIDYRTEIQTFQGLVERP